MTNHALQFDSKILQSLKYKLNELQEFNLLFSQYIGIETAKHCQIVRFEKNCLIILVESGSWATQLRFQTPELMKKLKNHPKLANLSGIICKTRPQSILLKSIKISDRKVSPLSDVTAKTVSEIAKTIRDTRLREILERIALYSV